MGWRVERMPLVDEPIEADWDRTSALHRQTLRRVARRRRPSDASSAESDDFEQLQRLPGADDWLAPPIIAPSSGEYDAYVDEPGEVTWYGCRECTTLVPTTSETHAWSHVVRAHRKACIPSDPEIWAVRHTAS